MISFQQTDCNWTDYIGQEIKIKVDRALGSLHPKWGFKYVE